MSELLNRFNKVYDYLYNCTEYPASYKLAVETFDNASGELRDLLCDFVSFRGDFFTSEREAAAFIYALFGGIENA